MVPLRGGRGWVSTGGSERGVGTRLARWVVFTRPSYITVHRDMHQRSGDTIDDRMTASGGSAGDHMRLDPPTGGDPRSGLWKLVGGERPWSTFTTLAHHYPPLRCDTSCDVAVVGAGVTGAMCAALLVDAGMDVMLLERGRVADGSTSANTALLLFEPDQPLHRLEAMLGERDADTVYQLTHQALDDIASLATRLDANDDRTPPPFTSTCFEWRPSLILASSADDVATLQREHRARQRHHYPTQLLGREEIEARYAFSAPAALRAQHAAQMDPVRFTRLLVADAASRGLRVHECTGVLSVQDGTDGATLTTELGHEVRARWVIMATGYETERYTSRKLARDNSTFAILTRPLDAIEGWPDRALIWETARPYIYLRTTSDNRVLIGGMDEETVDARERDAMLPGKARRRLARLRAMFPTMDASVDRSWAGTFLTTRDSLPYIGQLPGLSHVWFALAYGGNGTTFGMMAARLLRDQLLGTPREEMGIFRFDRPTGGG